ncbi:MAG: hypothetical protein EXX96DRAFT_447566, partial [Benjaminiella poitrasii]
LCITITIVIPAEISAIRSFGTCNIYWGGGALVGYYGGFIVIVAPIILWKLRNNSDAHGIRTEIWIDIIIGIPFFLLFTLWFSFNVTNHSIFSFYTHILFDPDKWAAFFTIIAHVISVVIPVIQFLLVENKCWSRLQSRLGKIRNSITKAIFLKKSTIRNTRAQIEEEAVLHSIFNTQLQPELSIESLERTLTDPEMLNQLQDLAIRDFSSENILFYESFIREESCNQVNISHQARHEIDEAFSTIYQKHP